VRGPAEVRAARGEGREAAEELPPGVKGADFKTLQDLIARGIQDAESGAKGLEATIRFDHSDESDLQRHREALRRRREEEAQAKEKEKQAAREKRHREDELRRRKIEEEFEREERQLLEAREAKTANEALCKRQLWAASRIQAVVRGRRSRAGMPLESPATVGSLHSEPWVPQGGFASLAFN